MLTFYATFGQRYYGGLLKNYYVEIKAESEEEAKNKMGAYFGKQWGNL